MKMEKKKKRHMHDIVRKLNIEEKGELHKLCDLQVPFTLNVDLAIMVAN